MDYQEKYEFWLDISLYDLETAKVMFQSGRYLYVVFMCQQSVEKLIKGLYVLHIGEEPPRTHNIWLVFKKLLDNELFANQIDNEMKEKVNYYKPFLAELFAYYISRRYPSYRNKLSTVVKKEKAQDVLRKTEEAFEWLQSLTK